MFTESESYYLQARLNGYGPESAILYAISIKKTNAKEITKVLLDAVVRDSSIKDDINEQSVQEFIDALLNTKIGKKNDAS